MINKPHSVTVSITSESGGVLNQEIILREYADSAEQLVLKNFAIADAVTGALASCMKTLAANAGLTEKK